MIRSILFPTDFSDVANSAFPLAATIAEACGASILALHVASRESRAAIDPEDDFPEADEFSGRVGREIVSKSDTESYAEVIIRKARKRGCDLIVMASHGRSDVAQFFLGRSVAEQVIRDSTTPTLVVRLTGARRSKRSLRALKHILYVSDLTAEARAVLPATVGLARAMKAQLDALCVFDQEGGPGREDEGRAALRQLIDKAEAGDLLGAIDAVRAAAAAETVVRRAAEHQVDLVALTSTLCCGGDPSLTKTAEQIIRRAPCPVLGMRP